MCAMQKKKKLILQTFHLRLSTTIVIMAVLQTWRISMASKREKIKLKSAESAFFYYTVKNKSSTPARLVLRKYDPTIRRHVEFKEAK